MGEVLFGTVHVQRLRRDVHIPAPDGRLAGREMLVEVGAQSLKPFQLVGILGRINLEALRHVGVDDRDPLDHHPEEPRVIELPSVIEPVRNRLGSCPAQHGDAVIGLHPAKRHLVAGGGQIEQRKVLILYLGFLQAEHVGLVAFEPAQDDGKALAQRIDVECCDLHRVFLSFSILVRGTTVASA